jgi:hypothetical protein
VAGRWPGSGRTTALAPSGRQPTTRPGEDQRAH